LSSSTTFFILCNSTITHNSTITLSREIVAPSRFAPPTSNSTRRSCHAIPERSIAPSVSHFLHCADPSYTESEDSARRALRVLETIEWSLSLSNPMHFLPAYYDHDLKSRTMGKYLLEEVGRLQWLFNDEWVRDTCSLASIMLITLSHSSPPILPITRRTQKAP
jgi:hypothetical protein